MTTTLSSTSSTLNKNLRTQIRKNIRHQRNQLSSNFQKQASKALTNQLINLPSVKSAKSLAIYLANDGELSPLPFIHWCWQQNKQIALPVIHPFNKRHILFLNYAPSSLMKNNRFNIPEPQLNVTQVIPVRALDIIFTPLVAFDQYGQRLGMGGGFYDRTLAFTNLSNNSPKNNKKINNPTPAIIGLAHDCQQVEKIPVELWDVPIPQIITPSKLIEGKPDTNKRIIC